MVHVLSLLHVKAEKVNRWVMELISSTESPISW